MASYTDLFPTAGALPAPWETQDMSIVAGIACSPANVSGYAFYNQMLATDDHEISITLGPSVEYFNLDVRRDVNYQNAANDSVSVWCHTGEPAFVRVLINNVGDTIDVAISRDVLTWTTGDVFTWRVVGSVYTFAKNGVLVGAWQDPGNLQYTQVNSTHRGCGFVTYSTTANRGVDAVTMQDVTSSHWTGPLVVAAAPSTLTASASPSVTFGTYWTPALNDVVVLSPSSTVVAATPTAPSGWVNPLGGTVDVESDAHELAAVYHLVTAGEVSAVTRTYTATSLYSAAQTGNTVAVVIRGADPANIVDSIATGFNNANVTAHTVPGLTGSALSTDSLILGIVAKDGTGTYLCPPGYGLLAASNVNMAKSVYAHCLPAVAGTNIAAADASTATDEYAAIAWALTNAPAGAFTGTGTLTSTATVTGAGSTSSSGTRTATATILGAGVVAAAGAGALTVTATATGTGATGSGAFTGTGTTTAATTIAGAGSTAAAGTLTTTATITGAGILGRVGAGTQSAAAAITGSGLTAATGTGTTTTTATITGSGVVGVSGTGSRTATATIAGAGTATAAGTLTATATIVGTGVLATTGGGSLTVAATIAGSAGTLILGTGTRSTTATITGSGTAAVTGAGTRTATATITGAGTAAATGTGAATTAATITGAGVVAVTGAGTRAVTATITGSSGVGYVGVGTRTVAASITGAGALGAPAVGGTITAITVITGSGIVARKGNGTILVVASITGSAGGPPIPQLGRIASVWAENRTAAVSVESRTAAVWLSNIEADAGAEKRVVAVNCENREALIMSGET